MAPATSTRPVRCLAFAAGTIVVGLIWRLAPLGMPQVAVKYGGSVLWAVMVYWLVGACLPRMPLLRVALVAGGVAAGVECFKLVHNPGLDTFRTTMAGKLLIGTYFSVWDIVAYWVAIGLVSALEQKVGGEE